jgi:hypothetical protein
MLGGINLNLRGQTMNLQYVIMAILAVAGFVAMGLMIGWFLSVTILLFCIFLVMKHFKIEGAGWVAIVAACLFFAWLVGPAAVEYRRGQLAAVVGGQPLPTPPLMPLSPEEQAAAEQRAEQEARLAAIEAAAQAEAAAAAELASRRAMTRTEAVDVRQDCRGRYANLRDCRNVYFGVNEKYSIEAVDGLCPRADPGDAGVWHRLAENQYDFIPNHDHVMVTFFNLATGESFYGSSCQ